MIFQAFDYLIGQWSHNSLYKSFENNICDNNSHNRGIWHSAVKRYQTKNRTIK